MSHFAGLVILTPEYRKNHDLDESLEKYSEEVEVPEYSRGEVSDFEKIKFLEYYLVKQNVKSTNVREKLYLELVEQKKKLPFSGETKEERDRCLYYTANENKERYIELFKEFNQCHFNRFDELYKLYGKNWNDGAWRINPISGKWEEYSTYNPYSVYDWYTTGGRWSDSMKTKYGEYVDECLLSDIDWTDFKPEDYEEKEETNIFGEKYHPLKDGVKWHFTKSNVPYCLFVDGEHISKGEMGWFGYSDDKMTEEEWAEKFFEVINRLPEDSSVTLVDFHI